MLTVVALLIIVLGLMVSLAWDVRRQSSERLTKDLLLKVHVLMNQYIEHHKRVPQISPFIETGGPPRESAVVIAPPLPTTRRGGRGRGDDAKPRLSASTRPAGEAAAAPPAGRAEDELPDEATLLAAAEANNREFVSVLRSEATGPQPELFGPLGGTMYDEVTLRDAWGTPLVFMPGQHPAIGMALGNKPFFFSAGPDRKFRTLEDNLYSYEQGTSAARGE
jgi:hypothetical protein